MSLLATSWWIGPSFEARGAGRRPAWPVATTGCRGHGSLAAGLPMQEMWIQNITLTMGLVDTVSIPTLLKMVASGRIPSADGGHAGAAGRGVVSGAVPVLYCAAASSRAGARAGAGAGRPAPAACPPGRRGSSVVSAAEASTTAALMVMAASMAETELARVTPSRV